uniref:Uncharacterized protein n=1 Tax=Attheya septentrionalis TaxID=420275 RepID=A0A6T7J5Q1_9STRA|mmetsp:Transcript_28767/g.52589  ORF Transcript_28767/g.52589 Transcript_28767/m.52589 type:complete len:208 (+) Transcript_28767:181-804(+)
MASADPLVEAYGTDRVVPIYIDLAKPMSIKKAASLAQDVQVVVNNAGVLELANPLDENAIPALEYQIQINVYGLVHMSQQFVPVLEKNGGGAFVQLNSTSSLRCAKSMFATYSASKAAAYSITQGLRASLRDTLVLSVHPGPIATDMVDQFGGRKSAEPASQVADCVVDAMKKGEFLVYTDTASRAIGNLYESFATNVIEPQSKYSE